MEIQLITGPNGSGKSLYAEEIAVQSGQVRIYIATMVPHTEENKQRIAKHIKQREGKGFVTLEQPTDLAKAEISADSVVLLEDVSNLLGNEMFVNGRNEQDVLDDILSLALNCKKLICVSISGLKAEGYDEETAKYINSLNRLNSLIEQRAAAVVNMHNGVAVRVK